MRLTLKMRRLVFHRKLTLRWFSVAAQRSDILDAVTLSLKVAALATLSALVLGDAGCCRAVYGDETFR